MDEVDSVGGEISRTASADLRFDRDATLGAVIGCELVVRRPRAVRDDHQSLGPAIARVDAVRVAAAGQLAHIGVAAGAGFRVRTQSAGFEVLYLRTPRFARSAVPRRRSDVRFYMRPEAPTY
jgi:hypothetical protein